MLPVNYLWLAGCPADSIWLRPSKTCATLGSEEVAGHMHSVHARTQKHAVADVAGTAESVVVTV